MEIFMQKKNDVLLIVLFTAFIFTFAVAFWIVPDKTFSEEENRSLSQFPRFSLESLLDGSFSEGINSYFADQFPARDVLVGIKGVSETALLKGENNGVLLGKNGQLALRRYNIYKSRLEKVPDMDYFYSETVELSIKGLNAYAATEERPLVTLLPPRTVDVVTSALSYPAEISDELHSQLTSSIDEKAGFIDLLPMLREKYENGEYVYYRTDHHWTAYGAYLAYSEVMKSFGMEAEIIPMDSFKVEEIEGFYGTTWSKSGCKFIGPDTLELWSLGNDDEFETNCIAKKVVKDETGAQVTVKEAYKTFDGWLNREHLSTKDKYSAFLDGTHNELTVYKKDGGERERLLIAKDSFANSMVPYLAQHFDLVIVNLSGKMTELSEYAEEYDVDRVLIVYNLENLITGNNLASVK